jgi:hypothetical protein
MSTEYDSPPPGTEVTDERMIIISTGYGVTFAAGHRMRAARCPVCQELIGGRTAMIAGFADLGKEPCGCRYIAAAAFLLHAGCSPQDQDDMAAIVEPFSVCEQPHH